MNRAYGDIRSVFMITGLVVALMTTGCGRSGPLQTIQTQNIKGLVITILGEDGELKSGRNEFVLEFKSAATGQPVDAGRVSMASIMSMPGMSPMSAGVELAPDVDPGRYRAKATFEMSGAWQFSLDWDGPSGRGSTTFNINVR